MIFGIMVILVVFLIGNFLVKLYGMEGCMEGVIVVVVYVVLILVFLYLMLVDGKVFEVGGVLI